MLARARAGRGQLSDEAMQMLDRVEEEAHRTRVRVFMRRTRACQNSSTQRKKRGQSWRRVGRTM